jgi:Tannase and feruloyl esterase
MRGLCAAACIILACSPLQTALGAASTPLEVPISAVLSCADLAREDFTQLAEAPTAITSALEVAAVPGTPAYCEVNGYVQPQVGFELRLPLTAWNGRYFQTGCGVNCGELRIQKCDGPLAGGFAVAAQNMGHTGTPAGPALWASDLSARLDYGPRSPHVTAVAAKAILQRFYGRPAAFSYFRGCSTGGREGLSEAQLYPTDFDGIIAGVPAFAGRLGAFGNNWDSRQLLHRDGTPVFTAAKLQLLHSAVLAACDALDGVKDGIITDPRRCAFDIGSLACPAGIDKPTCLTADQVSAARHVYDGARNLRGERLFPGHLMYGSEAAWNGTYGAQLSDNYLKYMVSPTATPLGYSHWDFDFERDEPLAATAARLYDPVAPHESPDLHAFRARGGKLISYHGWADPGVSPLSTLDYYARVTATEGGVRSVQTWFRLFMVPGMFHCRGGAAPNQFDFLPGLMAWVERGQAPDGIMASQQIEGRLVRTRPLFAYPAVATYTGKGDVNDGRNWRAVWPARQPQDDVDWIWAPSPGAAAPVQRTN